MKRVLGILLALSLGLNLGLLYMQFKGPPGPGPRPGPGPGQQGPPPRPRDIRRMVDVHVEGLSRHVGLDAAQQSALRSSLEASMPGLQAALERSERANQAVSRAFGTPDFDPEVFRRLVREAAEARNRIDSLSGAILLEEAAILTPEQRVEYAEVAPTIHSGGGRSQPPPGPRH